MDFLDSYENVEARVTGLVLVNVVLAATARVKIFLAVKANCRKTFFELQQARGSRMGC